MWNEASLDNVLPSALNKYGHDGVWIEGRINGGDWAFLAINTGSSRFRGVTTTYSVRHSQISAYLRHQARYAEITDLSHISHNNAA